MKGQRLSTITLLRLGVILLAPPMLLGIAFGQSAEPERQKLAHVVMRIWGANTETASGNPLADVVTRLEEAYKKHNPEARFENRFHGNDSALGGLYTGVANVVFMTRKPSYIELDGYRQVIQGQTPLQISVMRGSPLVSSPIPPIVLVVKATNPLTAVTLTNLKAVFGSDYRDTATLQTWSVLNASGSLAHQPIHLVGFDLNSDEEMIFAETVLGNSPRWTCNYRPEPASAAAARRIVDDVKHDPNALGITTLDRVTSEVKVLGLVGESGSAIYPTAENLASGTYPLFRTVLAITRRPSDNYQDGTTANFLSFLASPEGQQVVASDDRFLPVPHAAAADAVKAQR